MIAAATIVASNSLFVFSVFILVFLVLLKALYGILVIM